MGDVNAGLERRGPRCHGKSGQRMRSSEKAARKGFGPVGALPVGALPVGALPVGALPVGALKVAPSQSATEGNVTVRPDAASSACRADVTLDTMGWSTAVRIDFIQDRSPCWPSNRAPVARVPRPWPFQHSAPCVTTAEPRRHCTAAPLHHGPHGDTAAAPTPRQRRAPTKAHQRAPARESRVRAAEGTLLLVPVVHEATGAWRSKAFVLAAGVTPISRTNLLLLGRGFLFALARVAPLVPRLALDRRRTAGFARERTHGRATCAAFATDPWGRRTAAPGTSGCWTIATAAGSWALAPRTRDVYRQRPASQHALAQLGHGFPRGRAVAQRDEAKAPTTPVRIHRKVQLQDGANARIPEDLVQLVLTAVTGQVREEQRVLPILRVPFAADPRLRRASRRARGITTRPGPRPEATILRPVAAKRPYGNGPPVMQRAVEGVPHLLGLVFRCQRDEAETTSLTGLAIARDGDLFDARSSGFEDPPQLDFADAFGEARNKELASIRIGHVSRRGGLR